MLMNPPGGMGLSMLLNPATVGPIRNLSFKVPAGTTGNLFTWAPPLAAPVASMEIDPDGPASDPDLSFNTSTGVVSTVLGFAVDEVRVIYLHAVGTDGTEVWVRVTFATQVGNFITDPRPGFEGQSITDPRPGFEGQLVLTPEGYPI